MTYRDAYKQVMRAYDSARDTADKKQQERKQEMYRQVPELQEIDKTLSKIGMNLAKLALAGSISDVESMQTEAEILRTRRKELMRATVGENFLANVYNCLDCSDTGYIPVKQGYAASRCKCLQQRLINEYYSISNMKDALKEENFDTYDLRLFTTDVVQAEGLSTHANMENVYRLAMKFVTEFDTSFANLLLYGEPGLGKTFVCHCIAKDLLDAGRTVLYVTAPRLCKTLEDFRFNRESMSEPDEMLTTIDDVELLIIDDLGAEISTVVTSAALFDIINQRLLSRKPTVISTNLTPAALEMQYSERIVSRFFGNYQMIKFFGEDIRVKKKYGSLRI